MVKTQYGIQDFISDYRNGIANLENQIKDYTRAKHFTDAVSGSRRVDNGKSIDLAEGQAAMDRALTGIQNAVARLMQDATGIKGVAASEQLITDLSPLHKFQDLASSPQARAQARVTLDNLLGEYATKPASAKGKTSTTMGSGEWSDVFFTLVQIADAIGQKCKPKQKDIEARGVRLDKTTRQRFRVDYDTLPRHAVVKLQKVEQATA